MERLRKQEVRLPTGERIVFDWLPPEGAATAVAVFVHGLGSHRRGDKALHFAARCAALGWGFLAVDLRGHGDSDGSLETLTLSHCLEDLGAVLAWIPDGLRARLLIGSSMGGAVAAWYLRAHPQAGLHLALIAPSLCFPARFAELPGEELEAWRRSGFRRFLSEWIDLRIGYGLIEDGANYPYERLVREHEAATLILHGMQDTAVPWQDSVDFATRTGAREVDLLLIKGGDHRLTEHKAYLFDCMQAWLRRRGLMP